MRTKIDFGMKLVSIGKETAVCALLGLMLVGCGSDESLSDIPTGDVRQPALGINALGVNALGVNALGVNALGVNALGVNALGVNGLNFIHQSTSTNQDRINLLKYTMKCALRSNQYVAAHAGHSGCAGYPQMNGMYGLAQGWPIAGMSENEQRYVTACVLAHVNEHQTPQRIALHGVDPIFGSTPAERATMYMSEGRYWGNIFRSESWKNVCRSSGRNTGDESPENLDITLGRSCALNGCGVMTYNGNCPINGNIESQYNGWLNYNYTYSNAGYNLYGWIYQANSVSSIGYFPTVEAISPVSLEFEGFNGNVTDYRTCKMSWAYNSSILSAAVPAIVQGTGSPSIGDCTSAARCGGLDLTAHANGQKLRGMPSGLRLRYAFMTGEPVGTQAFYLRARYSAVGSNIQAKISINGSPLTVVIFPDTQGWDNYKEIFWQVPFVISPAALKANTCGNQTNPGNIPYAVYMDIEVQPGSTFPDLDSLRLEP